MNKLPKSKISEKADEIYRTTRSVCELIPDENKMLQEIKSQILENAMVLKVKLASAEKMKLWDLKMENASIIRKNARELVVQYHSLKMFGFEDVKYYKLVRDQLEEFRLLFRDWVADFNPKHFIVDDWGLFNPPGIAQDYQQRDDELNLLDDDEDDL